MKFLLLTAALVASPALAETVRIQTGEHAGFTRVVLDLSAPTGWQLNRTDRGYALHLDRAGIRFDLSQAFRSIPKTRLNSIWVDPQSGALQLGVVCACHAEFELVAGDVLVVDLADGPAAAGAPFERLADGTPAPPLAPAVIIRPRSRPPAAVVLPDLLALGLPEPRLDMPTPPPEDTLRDSILSGFGRAASAGLIDVADDLAARDLPATTSERLRVHLDGPAQLVIADKPGQPRRLTANGADCIADVRLAIEGWGGAGLYADEVALQNAGVVGEFDRVDPAGLSALVRFDLYYGFGAEASAALDAFPNALPDGQLWREMARLLDGEPVSPDGIVADQGACPGKAALWAALASNHPASITGLDRAAVRLSFSALPPHLRRQIGPALVESFLNDGDQATAQALADITDRAPGAPDRQEQLAKARLATEQGDPSRGEAIVRSVLPEAGTDQAAALIALVDTRIAQRKPIDPSVESDLDALAGEIGDGPQGRVLARARALTLATGGGFAKALDLAAPLSPEVTIEIWSILAEQGADSVLLDHAIAVDAALAGLPPADARRIAQRLIGLGFPEQALNWIAAGAGPDDLLLKAQAELAAGDAKAAMMTIAGATGNTADAVRAEALMRLGDLATAAQIYRRLGQDDLSADANWQAQDWAEVQARGPADRQEPVATLLTAPPDFAPTAATPLAQGRTLLAEADTASAAIKALLAAVPGP